ncbi:hypothetical protein [endosymbiont 'TC1' of Trimyema compressum]|uniref:hypothetical protein n=1 Tax=endosymbiont 'TC1' of Trimyema compressum TaxID=243899 RepID=UPI0013923082|nr:hypothetical protein [endosymbiont 'TC1' of Trimyema compressum]
MKRRIDQRFGSILENIDNNKKSGEKPDIIYIQAVSVQTHAPFGANKNPNYNVTYTGG